MECPVGVLARSKQCNVNDISDPTHCGWQVQAARRDTGLFTHLQLFATARDVPRGSWDGDVERKQVVEALDEGAAAPPGGAGREQPRSSGLRPPVPPRRHEGAAGREQPRSSGPRPRPGRPTATRWLRRGVRGRPRGSSGAPGRNALANQFGRRRWRKYAGASTRR